MYFYIYIERVRVKLSGVKGDIIDSIDNLEL